MRLIRARQSHNCIRCPKLILSGDEYAPQRRKRALCYDCVIKHNKNSLYNKAKRKAGNSIMGLIYRWVAKHGE